MANKLPKVWILCLLVCTAALLLAYRFGMNRVLRIDVNSDYPLWVYDDRSSGGASIATLDKTADGLVLGCNYSKQYAWPFCGFSIALAERPAGMDLSKFDRIEVNAQTSGPGQAAIRVYLRNFDPAYSTLDSPVSLKVNEVQYTPNQEPNPLKLNLNAFQVATWWINEFGLSPQLAAPDLSNVPIIEIATGERMQEGQHTITVGHIQFEGKWISYGQLSSIILAMWNVSALLYLIAGFWQARTAMRAIKQRKEELEQVNALLEIERNELKLLVTHDPLTGAYNRVGLRDHLYTRISRVKQQKSSLSVIFMDIDKFKQINDQYGHDCGDKMLKAFADFVAQKTRSRDFFCRLGGEEFVLLCDDTPLEGAARIAEKLRLAIEQHQWLYSIPLTCSFGVTEMKSEEDVSRFFKRADEALYRAKAGGRNRVVSVEAEAA